VAQSGNRQQIRLREIRPPDVVDDQKSEPQVRGALPQVQDFEQFNNLMLSVLRSIQGSTGWNVPAYIAPPTTPATPTSPAIPAAVQIFGEPVLGLQNGVNLSFALAYTCVPQTLRLYYNGLRQRFGPAYDYTLAESLGAGTGFNTIVFNAAAAAPKPADDLLADYIRL
jgi:hypothetical protein